MSFFGHSGTGAVFGERYWRDKIGLIDREHMTFSINSYFLQLNFDF